MDRSLPDATTGVQAALPRVDAGPPPDDEADLPTPADRLFHAQMGRWTGYLSPGSACLAWTDWLVHLSASPGKQQLLAEKAMRKSMRLAVYVARTLGGADCPHCIEPLVQDRRFRAPQWQQWPFCFVYQTFLLQQQWWHNATTGIGGVSAHHQQLASFAARQWLDTVSPVNFIATNPEVLDATLHEGGQNLLRGLQYLTEDWERAMGGHPPVGAEAYRPGREVAVTPGRVVFRNRLIELIQYAPQTDEVQCQPLLFIPAWIMKYYILDLSPRNSLVRYLVGRGHTVYMISWRNPGTAERDLGMDDYLREGALAALAQVRQREQNERVQAVGYCLGGTLLAILAAWLAQQGRDDLASVTLLAAQTDFIEAGELRLFIDDSQLDYLDDVMWQQGYLDNRQMAGAFQLLRSRDLIWSRMVNNYLLGRREQMSDLMAWNADATRMPYRMQSEYLRQLFLDNQLFAGRYRVDGRAVALGDIRVPTFVVATESDHVAPWRSVYKLRLMTGADMEFLLTSGGHNAGICSEPGHPRRHFRAALCRHSDPYVDPDHWFRITPVQVGSWWPHWAGWLVRDGQRRSARALACDDPALPSAPGDYVLEK